MTAKHFLDLDAFDAATLRKLIDEAKRMKTARKGRPKGAPDDATPLKGRMLALIFEKPSTRTRISFEMGMRQLGGDTMFLDGRDMQFGHGETVGDTARVLSRYVDAIMLRTKRHQSLIELAQHATRAGDQRADRQDASVPVDGRRDDVRGASRADRGTRGDVVGRRQQCLRVVDSRSGAFRLSSCASLARRRPSPIRA